METIIEMYKMENVSVLYLNVYIRPRNKGFLAVEFVTKKLSLKLQYKSYVR